MKSIALWSQLAACAATPVDMHGPRIRRVGRLSRIMVLALTTALVSACGGGGSDAGSVAIFSQPASAPPSDSSQSSSPLPFAWPSGAGASRIFDYSSAVTPPVADYTRASRFVLYDSGRFAAQFANVHSGDIYTYSGQYQEGQGAINFDWDGASTAGAWGATGRLDGASLRIRYNTTMQLTDFEDALYVRAP